MLPHIKQSGQVLSPVEIHVPSDKPKPTSPLPGGGTSVQNGHGGSGSGPSSSAYSANPLASLGDGHNLDRDHVNPEHGPPSAYQESLGKAPKSLAKQTPVIGYKKLSRDNAVAVLQKLNSREALQASRGILASGLIDPANPLASADKLPKPYTRERKYSKQVVSKPTIGSIAAMQRRKKSGRGRELNVKSTVEDVKAFRKSIIPPAAMLGIVKDEFHEFAEAAPIAASAAQPSQASDATAVNPFFVLCDDVTNSLAEFEAAMQSFSLWKNDFLKQNVTSSVKLTLALMVAKIIRSQSDLSQLVLEMVRSVRTYSAHWGDKINAIMELEQEHARQARAFDIAIRKIENMHGQVARGKINRQIFMWEYITKKLLRRAQDQEKLGGSDDDESDDDVPVSRSQMLSESQAAINRGATGSADANGKNQVTARGTKRRAGGGMRGATKIGKLVSVSEQQLDDVSGIPGGRGRRPAGNDQRLEGIRAMLDAKRRERAEQQSKSKPEEVEVPEGVVREQRFNELVNLHHPFLARAIYVLTNHEVHLPMYYASEVFMLDYGPAVATESNALNQLMASKSRLSLARKHRTPNWTAEDAVELSKPIALRGLVRSNSTNAVFLLGKKARETFAPLKEQELMQKASDALMRAAKARLPPHSYHFDHAFRLSSPDKPNSAPNTMEAAAAALNIDLSKTWFTLQDVLELSLLHMQQIQCLRGQYEQTVHDLTQLNAQNNVIPKNWQYAPDPPSETRTAEKRKSSSSVTPIRRKSTPSSSSPKPQTPASRRRTANGPRHRPMQLNSSLLNLNFMERMSRLASKSEKRKADLAEETVRREMEDNLTRAVRDKRQVFSKDQVVELMERVLPAVFMPLPEKEATDLANSFPSRPPSHVLDKMRRSPAHPRSASSGDGTVHSFDLLEVARSISRPTSSKEDKRPRQ